ncbi:MAG: 50S ribosomal protein L3 [Candidatus Verstraetearchaeota archaeon]|nr:50S ribosomal protein L3 [Candidatus Verstraetearchaeota archaeon]
MGHKSKSAPRRGSLMYYPRVRARRITGRIRTWPKVAGAPRLLGFAGYKVGSTHAIIVDNRQKSPLFGKEVMKAVTVIEVPPMFVYGYRAYVRTSKGLKTLAEVMTKSLPKYADRALSLSEDYDPAPVQASIDANAAEIAEVRVLVLTQPYKAGFGKKTPEILEIKVDGDDIKAVLDYAKSLLGKEVRAKELFQEGQCVDLISVTKGKGFQGAVKRFGVKIQPNWHKHRKGKRVVGSISPSKPHMMFTIPRPGKMGFHQRTEYNKRILKIGENPSEINVSGGFLHYGIVGSDYLLIEGSVAGPAKRLVRIRYPVRAQSQKVEPPKVLAVSLVSKQGA